MNKLKTFVSAVLAGVCIGIGGTVFLSLDNKIIGSALFTVGLFVICTLGFNLFTGKVCYVPDNKPSYIIDLVFIWLGNLVGTGMVAVLIRSTRVSASLIEKAQTLVQVKLDDSLFSIFILAIFCNILIFIAVEGYKTITDGTGRYVALFLGIMTFILCGFEHCVADMYYVIMAGQINLQALLVLLVATAGNCVGGILFRLGELYVQGKKG